MVKQKTVWYLSPDCEGCQKYIDETCENPVYACMEGVRVEMCPRYKKAKKQKKSDKKENKIDSK